MSQTYDFRPTWQRLADYKNPSPYTFNSSEAFDDPLNAKVRTSGPLNQEKIAKTKEDSSSVSYKSHANGGGDLPTPSLPKIDLSNFGKIVAAGCLLLYAYKSLKDDGIDVELQHGSSTKRSLFVWVDVSIAAVVFLYLVRYAVTII